ncbi:hypothetical protein ACLX1H_008969 [Fusarium chlamydosporum]
MASQSDTQVSNAAGKTTMQESESLVPICDWTEKAEKKLRRKIDFTVLPILMLGLFALQLDRGNVGYAMTTSFTDDLGITKDIVNYGNQLMLAAVVIFEIPGLLAGLIFRIPETSGLKRWQWLFLIDGIFTILVGVVFIFIMPRSTTDTLPLAGIKKFNVFTDKERDILAKRVILDDPRKSVKLSGISPKTALRICFTNFPMWGHFSINAVNITPKGGINTHDPKIRCIGIALAVTGSNIGGLAGQNIFQESDAPYYPKGFLKILCLYAGSIVLIAGMIFYYWNDNRKMKKVGELENADETEGSDR